jgi:hypothetical protein|tara:strand:- start:113 stop:691 length:579 start_codon:yes stop_codon:yes gene_type:complete
MNKKFILQIILLFFLLFTFALIYYYQKNKEKNPKMMTGVDNLQIKKGSANLMQDIEYFSKDGNGNQYVITSKTGETDITNPDIIFMTDVYAEITFAGTDSIKIRSLNAKYNNKNYETKFIKNVTLNYLEHQVNSENLDLSFEKNLASIYNSLIYQNADSTLKADRFEMDLITKDSKIFMNDKTKKIKAVINN